MSQATVEREMRGTKALQAEARQLVLQRERQQQPPRWQGLDASFDPCSCVPRAALYSEHTNFAPQCEGEFFLFSSVFFCSFVLTQCGCFDDGGGEEPIISADSQSAFEGWLH